MRRRVVPAALTPSRSLPVVEIMNLFAQSYGIDEVDPVAAVLVTDYAEIVGRNLRPGRVIARQVDAVGSGEWKQNGDFTEGRVP